MTKQPISLDSLQEEITTLKRYVIGLSAVIAALPDTVKVDNEKVHAFVVSMSGQVPEPPYVADAVPQAMFIAQTIQAMAKQNS